MQIVSNQAGAQNQFGDHEYAFWSAASFNNDQYSQATLVNIGSWSGLILRADNVVDRFYLAFVFGANDYRIYKRWDGGYIQVAQASSETWVAGDIMKFTVEGSAHPVTLRLFRNGVEVLNYTTADASEVKTGGSPGIGMFSFQNLLLDDWQGGNLGGMGIRLPHAQAPSARGNLVAMALGVSEVKLSWMASTDNGGAKKYEVQRQEPGSTSFVHVRTTTGTSYTDTGLAAGSSYSYRVLVRDAKGSLKKYVGMASVTTASPTINPRRSR